MVLDGTSVPQRCGSVGKQFSRSTALAVLQDFLKYVLSAGRGWFIECSVVWIAQ